MNNAVCLLYQQCFVPHSSPSLAYMPGDLEIKTMLYSWAWYPFPLLLKYIFELASAKYILNEAQPPKAHGLCSYVQAKTKWLNQLSCRPLASLNN